MVTTQGMHTRGFLTGYTHTTLQCLFPWEVLLWHCSCRYTPCRYTSASESVFRRESWGAKGQRRACALEVDTLLILFIVDKWFQWPVLPSPAPYNSLAHRTESMRWEGARALLSQSPHTLRNARRSYVLAVYLTMLSCWARLCICLQPLYPLLPSSLSASRNSHARWHLFFVNNICKRCISLPVNLSFCGFGLSWIFWTCSLLLIEVACFYS